LLLALPVHVARALALAFDLEPCGLFAKLAAMSLVQGFEARSSLNLLMARVAAGNGEIERGVMQ
jgi:hypothetical protein